MLLSISAILFKVYSLVPFNMSLSVVNKHCVTFSVANNPTQRYTTCSEGKQPSGSARLGNASKQLVQHRAPGQSSSPSSIMARAPSTCNAAAPRAPWTAWYPRNGGKIYVGNSYDWWLKQLGFQRRFCHQPHDYVRPLNKL